jgi:hypothetical protein
MGNPRVIVNDRFAAMHMTDAFKSRNRARILACFWVLRGHAARV